MYAPHKSVSSSSQSSSSLSSLSSLSSSSEPVINQNFNVHKEQNKCPAGYIDDGEGGCMKAPKTAGSNISQSTFSSAKKSGNIFPEGSLNNFHKKPKKQENTIAECKNGETFDQFLGVCVL